MLNIKMFEVIRNFQTLLKVLGSRPLFEDFYNFQSDSSPQRTQTKSDTFSTPSVEPVFSLETVDPRLPIPIIFV